MTIYAFADNMSAIRYVGCTSDVHLRTQKHWTTRYRKEAPIALWLRDLEKLPQFHLIELADDDVCWERESFWIEYYKNVSGDKLLNVMHPKTHVKPVNTKPYLRGTANGHAKLTEDNVREIRSSNLSLDEPKTIYGVSYTVIRQIKRGKAWTHVE